MLDIYSLLYRRQLSVSLPIQDVQTRKLGTKRARQRVCPGGREWQQCAKAGRGDKSGGEERGFRLDSFLDSLS
jgi:hypothetical protein